MDTACDWPDRPRSDALIDDRFLVRAFLAGDEQAFRELYRRFTPALYRIVWRLTGGRDDDAADIVQEVWLRASRRLATFRWEAALPTWLTSIAINCVRERSRRAHEAALPLTDEIPIVRTDHRRLELEQAIQSLAEGYREVLVLHDIEGYTHEEIAGLLEIEPGTSKSQLFRARRALRAALSRETP
jgi:RNA polymerase sigma-70 factor (ECF subfamily)